MRAPTRTPAAPWILGSPWRLLATLFLTLALPMAAFGFLSTRQVRLALEEEAQRLHVVAARYAAQVVEEHFNGSLRYVSGVAGRQRLVEGLRDRNASEAVRELRALVEEQQRFDRAFVTDAGGVLRYDFPPQPAAAGRRLADQEWFRGVSGAERPYLASIAAREAPNGQTVVSIAAPIIDRGRTIGYLVAQERTDALTERFAWAAPSPDSRVVLIDRRGSALMAGAAPFSMQGDELARRALGKQEGTVVAPSPRSGEEGLIGYSPIEPLGWAVLVMRPIDEVLAPIRAMQRTLMGLTGTVTVAMLLLSSVWLRTISRYQRYRSSVEATLARSHDELQTISYSLSHDLRTPLRGIDGFSHVLLEEYGGALDDEGRAYLERVRAASQKMGVLLDDFVRYLSIDRAELQPRPVDMSAIAREISEGLSRSQPERKVRWAIESDVSGLGDPKLLRQLIENLLDNAWKFTSTRPTAHIRFGCKRRRHETIYFVRDDGVGFDMAYADKLFRPFQRLHAAGEFEGSGTGLAIAARIVRRHGGRIWAEARLGHGATFYFTLGKEA